MQDRRTGKATTTCYKKMILEFIGFLIMYKPIFILFVCLLFDFNMFKFSNNKEQGPCKNGEIGPVADQNFEAVFAQVL